jgi:hypothetical protein
MSGPRPAGRLWTLAEEAELRELIASKIKVIQIAKKLKRSPGAIYARILMVTRIKCGVQCGASRIRSVIYNHIKYLQR